MHHSNFLKATGHQRCLSALYRDYGTGELQRTHSQAKNIPASLYAPVDYSIITLIRSKGNYHFANQVSLLLIHKVSHATIILGHASGLQQQGHCTHTTLQGGCSSPRHQLWTSPPAGVGLLYPSHGQAQTEPMWLSGDRGSVQAFWLQSRDICQRFTLPALNTSYHGWCLQCDTDTAQWQLCVGVTTTVHAGVKRRLCKPILIMRSHWKHVTRTSPEAWTPSAATWSSKLETCSWI